MKPRPLRLVAAVLLGLVVIAGMVALLGRALGDHEARYAGQTLYFWQQQLHSGDTVMSNQAFGVVNSEVIPQLILIMNLDTNDSRLRLAAVEWLNRLPGVRIGFTGADGRRSYAAGNLGELGPAAVGAVPALIQVVKGADAAARGPALLSLGKIHAETNTVIPVLLTVLHDENVRAEAATALGDFGNAARAAVPDLLMQLKARDKEARYAAQVALKKIDPAAAAQAGVK